MSEDQKSNICLFVTLTFLLIGLTGIVMGIYIETVGIENVNNKVDKLLWMR